MVLLSLLALLIGPFVVTRFADRLRAAITYEIEPAQAAADHLMEALGDQAAASRAAVALPDRLPAYRQRFVHAEQAAGVALARLHEVEQHFSRSPLRVAEAERAVGRYSEVTAELFSGAMSAADFISLLPVQDARLDDAQDQVRQVQGRLEQLTTEHRAATRALAGLQDRLTAALALLMLVAGGFAVWLDRRSRRFGQALRERERARQSAALRSEVLAQVSHDLKTPLSAILLGARTLLRRGQMGREDASRVARIERSGQRMRRMITDVLDAARLEGGQRLSLSLAPVRLRSLADACADEVDGQRGGRTIECAVPDELPLVWADAARIEQVFCNLLGNALKFTSERGHVRVAAEPCGDGVHVSVADDGAGIAGEHLEHLFEPFWQAEETAAKGAGLGLSIVSGIVSAHGGRVWAESTPGEGTTMHFTLPCAPPA